jgi:hypothetical protein
VFVTPSLPFGASSLRLHFLGSWSAVDISYTAEAEAAWIRQFNLRTGLGGTGGAHLSANGLFTFVLPFDPQKRHLRCRDPRTRHGPPLGHGGRGAGGGPVVEAAAAVTRSRTCRVSPPRRQRSARASRSPKDWPATPLDDRSGPRAAQARLRQCARGPQPGSARGPYCGAGRVAGLSGPRTASMAS